MTDKVDQVVRYSGEGIEGQYEFVWDRFLYPTYGKNISLDRLSDELMKKYPEMILCVDGQPFRHGLSTTHLRRPARSLRVEVTLKDLPLNWEEVEQDYGPFGYAARSDIGLPD